MNAPDRLDAVRVPEGLPKIAATVDGKMTNATTYRIMREDHTLGHLLRMELLRDPAVRFAGYKHPHPLENDILVKVQAAPGTTTTAVLSAAASRLETDFNSLQHSFREQVAAIVKKEEQIGGDGLMEG